MAQSLASSIVKSDKLDVNAFAMITGVGDESTFTFMPSWLQVDTADDLCYVGMPCSLVGTFMCKRCSVQMLRVFLYPFVSSSSVARLRNLCVNLQMLRLFEGTPSNCIVLLMPPA